MTNSEYFEKRGISFAKAMEIFNAQKSNGIKSFDEFLASKHVEPKFKMGDIVVMQLNEETRLMGWKHNVVLEITGVGFYYVARRLTPDEIGGIGFSHWFLIDFIDRNCVLY